MEITRTAKKLIVTLPNGTVRIHEGGADLLDREEARYRAQQSSQVNNQPGNIFYGQLPQFGQRNLFGLPTFDQRDLLDLPSTACEAEDSAAGESPASFGQLLDFAGDTAPIANYAPPAGSLITNEDMLDVPSMTFDPPQGPAIGVLGAGTTRNANRQEQRPQTAAAAVALETMDAPSWSF